MNLQIEKRELLDYSISILVIGFILSFNDWPTLQGGLSNLTRLYIPIVFFSFLAREITKRYFADRKKLELVYRAWYLGLIVSLVLVLISNGFLLFIAPGITAFAFSQFGQIGRKKEGIKLEESSNIVIYGVIANFALAFVFKALGIIPGVIINGALALYTLLPIPPLDGKYVLANSTKKWIFMFLASILVMFGLPVLDLSLTVLALLATAISVFLVTYHESI